MRFWKSLAARGVSLLRAGHLVSATGTTVWRVLKRTGITPAVVVVTVSRRPQGISVHLPKLSRRRLRNLGSLEWQYRRSKRANILTILLLPEGSYADQTQSWHTCPSAVVVRSSSNAKTG
jgi:hypothetical protein